MRKDKSNLSHALDIPMNMEIEKTDFRLSKTETELLEKINTLQKRFVYEIRNSGSGLWELSSGTHVLYSSYVRSTLEIFMTGMACALDNEPFRLL